MTEQFPNDLQALWDDQPADLNVNNMKELTMTLQKEHRKEQQRLFFLNMQEVIPAVGLFLWFGWKGFQATTREWAWFAASLLALGVGLYLIASSVQQRQLEKTFDDSTRGALERSRSQMQHRAQLYRTVAWWYLLPAAIAIVLTLIASEVDFTTTFTLGYLGVAALFFGGVYYWNRKIGREKYEPKVEHFTRLLAEIGDASPS